MWQISRKPSIANFSRSHTHSRPRRPEPASFQVEVLCVTADLRTVSKPQQAFSPSSTKFSQRLVADELVASALQPYPRNTEDQRKRKHCCVPVHHRMRPARRQRPVLPCPQRDQRPDDEGLKAQHQKKLSATAALIQQFHLLRCQIAFFDGKQCVRHY